MALKAATTVIPASVYAYSAVQVTRKTDGLGQSAPQKTTTDGVPVWTVDVLRNGPEGADILSVSVPSPMQPAVRGEVAFTNLRAGLWLGEKSRQGGLYWQADAVSPATAPKRD